MMMAATPATKATTVTTTTTSSLAAAAAAKSFNSTNAKSIAELEKMLAEADPSGLINAAAKHPPGAVKEGELERLYNLKMLHLNQVREVQNTRNLLINLEKKRLELDALRYSVMDAVDRRDSEALRKIGEAVAQQECMGPAMISSSTITEALDMDSNVATDGRGGVNESPEEKVDGYEHEGHQRPAGQDDADDCDNDNENAGESITDRVNRIMADIKDGSINDPDMSRFLSQVSMLDASNKELSSNMEEVMSIQQMKSDLTNKLMEMRQESNAVDDLKRIELELLQRKQRDLNNVRAQLAHLRDMGEELEKRHSEAVMAQRELDAARADAANVQGISNVASMAEFKESSSLFASASRALISRAESHLTGDPPPTSSQELIMESKYIEERFSRLEEQQDEISELRNRLAELDDIKNDLVKKQKHMLNNLNVNEVNASTDMNHAIGLLRSIDLSSDCDDNNKGSDNAAVGLPGLDSIESMLEDIQKRQAEMKEFGRPTTNTSISRPAATTAKMDEDSNADRSIEASIDDLLARLVASSVEKSKFENEIIASRSSRLEQADDEDNDLDYGEIEAAYRRQMEENKFLKDRINDVQSQLQEHAAGSPSLMAQFEQLEKEMAEAKESEPTSSFSNARSGFIGGSSLRHEVSRSGEREEGRDGDKYIAEVIEAAYDGNEEGEVEDVGCDEGDEDEDDDDEDDDEIPDEQLEETSYEIEQGIAAIFQQLNEIDKDRQLHTEPDQLRYFADVFERLSGHLDELLNAREKIAKYRQLKKTFSALRTESEDAINNVVEPLSSKSSVNSSEKKLIDTSIQAGPPKLPYDETSKYKEVSTSTAEAMQEVQLPTNSWVEQARVDEVFVNDYASVKDEARSSMDLPKRSMSKVKESIYRHAATTISMLDGEPYFLLQLFRNVKKLKSHAQRQKLMLVLDEIVAGDGTEAGADDGGVGGDDADTVITEILSRPESQLQMNPPVAAKPSMAWHDAASKADDVEGLGTVPRSCQDAIANYIEKIILDPSFASEDFTKLQIASLKTYLQSLISFQTETACWKSLLMFEERGGRQSSDEVIDADMVNDVVSSARPTIDARLDRFAGLNVSRTRRALQNEAISILGDVVSAAVSMSLRKTETPRSVSRTGSISSRSSSRANLTSNASIGGVPRQVFGDESKKSFGGSLNFGGNRMKNTL